MHHYEAAWFFLFFKSAWDVLCFGCPNLTKPVSPSTDLLMHTWTSRAIFYLVGLHIHIHAYMDRFRFISSKIILEHSGSPYIIKYLGLVTRSIGFSYYCSLHTTSFPPSTHRVSRRYKTAFLTSLSGWRPIFWNSTLIKQSWKDLLNLTNKISDQTSQNTWHPASQLPDPAYLFLATSVKGPFKTIIKSYTSCCSFLIELVCILLGISTLSI